MGAVLTLLLAVLMLMTAGVLLFVLGHRPDALDQEELRRRVLGGDVAAAQLASPAGERGTRDPVIRFICSRLWRAGIGAEPPLVQRMLWTGGVIVLLALLLLGPAAGVTVVASLLLLAWAWLARREARRRALLIQQLPDFLEHVTRALGAGNSLEEGLAEATSEAPEPIRGLFVSVTRQVRLGAPVDDVLYEIANLQALNELRVMAMAARVNRRFGGSLRRIFKSLIQAIRERDAAGRELRALTAETRFSAFTLAFVPVGLMLYILLQNPGYYAEMWAETAGRNLILASVLLQATGVALIWRMLQSAEDEQR